MNKLLALVSALYATPFIGSTLASATIIYKPENECDPRGQLSHRIWDRLEKTAYYRTTAFATYALISYATQNSALVIADCIGYFLPIAIEGINRIHENMRYWRIKN